MRAPNGDRPGERVRRIGAVDLGHPAVATIRLVLPLPDGRLAVGSDYALTLRSADGRVEPFPFPEGVRDKVRVEAMAACQGVLHVATAEATFRWPLAGGDVSSKRLPSDGADGRDDVRVMRCVGDRLYIGWRCRFEGGEGPADVLAIAPAPNGDVWVGTRDGILAIVDRGEVRRFGDDKPRPVRHLAWAEGALWVAADRALWRCRQRDAGGHEDQWTRLDGAEPTSLTTDPGGHLWGVRDGRVVRWDGRTLAPVGLDVARPWCLAFQGDVLWVGAPGALWQADVAAPGATSAGAR